VKNLAFLISVIFLCIHTYHAGGLGEPHCHPRLDRALQQEAESIGDWLQGNLDVDAAVLWLAIGGDTKNKSGISGSLYREAMNKVAVKIAGEDLHYPLP